MPPRRSPGRRVPAGAAGTVKSGADRQPTRVGQARPSQLITTSGVGATIDLPSISVMVRGLDTWNPEHQELIDEPRLLEAVRDALGPQVRALKHAPWEQGAEKDGWTRTGVPVAAFPHWVRCPVCYRLGAIDPPGQFELMHRYGRRPDLAKYVHAQCAKQSGKRLPNRTACLPARFVVACEDGHVDDFPYVQYVHNTHEGGLCDGPILTMSDQASTLSPLVTIRCVQCQHGRSIVDATGWEGWKSLPRCRGRHPHLQQFEDCGKRLRLMVLGASNLWFPVSASALHLPNGSSLKDLVSGHWDALGKLPDAQTAQTIIELAEPLRELRLHPIGDVWACVERIRDAGGPDLPEPSASLRGAEWQLLARPTTERQDDDFRAEVTPSPSGYGRLLDQVVLVPRLRETRALTGFTRLASPDRDELRPPKLIRLSRGPADWVPAVEQRGEGIFLQLREDMVSAWVSRVHEHEHITALRNSYRQWAFDRAQTPQTDFPVARFTLIHTLSHMLMRQVALECGYSSASLRERLYLGTPDAPAAGVLISTAASDSEGTLGGLVALGQARHLERLLGLAFEEAEHCSSDPLCAEHLPTVQHATLHAAACHACLFASETSCESGNRWLDRAVLADLTGDGLAFPR